MPQDSIPWGDKLMSGQEVMDSGIFRVLSHNVNGLSKANHQLDVLLFARAMKKNGSGIRDTRNEPQLRADGNAGFVSYVIRSVSSHHHGAVSSAHLQLSTDYQPGGTAVSVRDKWASRFLMKGSDELWLTLTGRGTTKITFISGYRVCNGASESALT